MWHPGIRDGRKWRQKEELGGKMLPTRAKNGVLHKIMFKMAQTELTMELKWLREEVN